MYVPTTLHAYTHFTEKKFQVKIVIQKFLMSTEVGSCSKLKF